MSLFNKVFSFLSTKHVEVPQEKSSLECIIELIEDAKVNNKECVFVSVTDEEFELPIEVDLVLRNHNFSDFEQRIEYNYHLMAQLEKLGYYAATREGNKTDQAFSSLFIMVA